MGDSLFAWRLTAVKIYNRGKDLKKREKREVEGACKSNSRIRRSCRATCPAFNESPPRSKKDATTLQIEKTK